MRYCLPGSPYGLVWTTPITKRRQSLFAMAFSALEQAKSYDPQSPIVLESYAEYYRQTGQPEKAEQLLKETKDSPLLWRFYIKTGRYDDARKSLEQYYQTNPKDVNVLEGLLFIAETTGDKTAATKYGEQLLSATEASEIHLLVIQSYLNLGLIEGSRTKTGKFQGKIPPGKQRITAGLMALL